MYSVYKHTCPNNKVYIGITSRKPEKRWKNGYGYIDTEIFIDYESITKANDDVNCNIKED